MPQADPALDFLLSSDDPSVRYLTLVELLGESQRSRAVRSARQEIPDGPKVGALLRGQRPDGGFGVHPYAKWTGAFWRLISLVELAIPPRHPGARAAVDDVFAWLHGDRHRATIRTIAGRVRQHACQEGFALAVCCRLDMARDGRVRPLVDSLLAAQWPDGGWNCDRSPRATHASFHESLGPLWGLAEYARATSDDRARRAADAAAEFFLAHAVFKSHRTGTLADPRFLRIRYPTYWHYDVLQGLLALCRAGRGRDRRAAEALDLIEAKRRRDGCWRAEGSFWRPPGSAGSNGEVVDWGRRGPSEMLTLNALRVLRAAERV